METKDNHKIDGSKPKINNHWKIIGIFVIILALWLAGVGDLTNNIINNAVVPNEEPDCSGGCRRFVSAIINIESIWNNDGKISFIIKNTGTYTYSKEVVSNFRIYIYDIPYENFQTTVNNIDGNLLFDCLERLREPSSICQIDTDIDFPSKIGEEGRVNIKVIPPLGSGDVYSCMIESTPAKTC